MEINLDSFAAPLPKIAVRAVPTTQPPVDPPATAPLAPPARTLEEVLAAMFADPAMPLAFVANVATPTVPLEFIAEPQPAPAAASESQAAPLAQPGAVSVATAPSVPQHQGAASRMVAPLLFTALIATGYTCRYRITGPLSFMAMLDLEHAVAALPGVTAAEVMASGDGAELSFDCRDAADAILQIQQLPAFAIHLA